MIDATDGEGADVVIDAAGYEATWAMGLRAVRSGGRIDEVGLGSGPGTVDFFAVLGKEATITGSYAWGDADFTRAIELVSQGVLDVDGWLTTMALADGHRAFEELVGGAGHFKVVLVRSRATAARSSRTRGARRTNGRPRPTRARRASRPVPPA